MKRIILLGMLLIVPTLSAWPQGGVAKHGICTNATADATNKVWQSPYAAMNWISFCNDSTSTVYVTPSLTNITSYFSTNNYFVYTNGATIYPSNVTINVTNVLDNTLSAGKGTRLNANGGCVFWDWNGQAWSKP